MNNPFTLRQWLQNQPPMSPPKDDFDAIFNQINHPRRPYRVRPWLLAAAIMTLVFSALVITNGPGNHSTNGFDLNDLQHQVSQLENSLTSHPDNIAGLPGSGDLETQVQLEQWLNHLNTRLAANNNAQQRHELLQAKLSILKNLTPNSQSIQLI
ncbi:MAG: hypothetical protein DWP95_10870 [Proteobacteria bacterium]|nr:MAG: hypothetical protein DWP95_10870 [Pseudomonadota bacterium]